MVKKIDKVAIPDEVITSMIYLIRDKKIMLDEDLAELYGVTTGNLNKAVKRNISRFPEDFMFQLTKEEFDNLIFQIGRSSWGGRRTPPYAFSEQGVAMLSGVLNSEVAIKVNIQIMRIFTRMREGSVASSVSEEVFILVVLHLLILLWKLILDFLLKLVELGFYSKLYFPYLLFVRTGDSFPG